MRQGLPNTSMPDMTSSLYLCPTRLLYTYTSSRILHNLLPQLQLRIHTHNTPDQVPIPIVSNPITDHNTCTSVSHVLAIYRPIEPRNSSIDIVFRTQELNNRRVQFRRNLLRPTPDFPEITRTQEVNIKWLLGRRLRALNSHARQNAHALRRSP